MFATACSKASRFTRPVIIRRRFFDRSVQCSCGAFVILNEEGWIVSAAHLWNAWFRFLEDAEKIAEHGRQAREIRNEPDLNYEQKHERVGRLPADPRWITNISYWWGREGVQLKEMKLLPDGDLVLGRLEPFEPPEDASYPVIKDPSRLEIGTSLCKLGYPFYRIQAEFDEATENFRFSRGTEHPVRFPVEGIYTRDLPAGRSRDGRYEIKFLETSSPGILGQSGGPIFDTKSSLWGVQSRTDMYPLRPRTGIGADPGESEESAYFNVGVGIHPEMLVTFLKDNDVRFTLSDY